MAYFDGGLGNDVLLGTSSADTMAGDEGNDRLNAGGGDDLVKGGSGDDNLAGQAGDDTLFGDSGDDILFGGSGNDLLSGGFGSDKFSFDHFNFSNGTVDTITDFKRFENDTIELKNGVQITGVSYEQRDGTGAAQDVRLTLTSTNGSTQTLWLNDAVRLGNTQAVLDAYFASLGFGGGGDA